MANLKDDFIILDKINKTYEIFLKNIFNCEFNSNDFLYGCTIYRDADIDIRLGARGTGGFFFLCSTDKKFYPNEVKLKYMNLNKQIIETDITINKFQELYDDDPTLFGLTLIADCESILSVMKLVKNLPEFIDNLELLKKQLMDSVRR